MQKMKKILKFAQITAKNKFGNSFIYNYQRILLKLTIILIVAVMIVIKECTVPLLLDNKVIRFFFYSNESGDKTFYNIGTSVIAAYIFYLFQVHIPEKTRCKKKMNTATQNNIHQIIILEQFVKAWHEFLGCKEETYFCHFKEFQYTTNRGKCSLSKELYKETIEELLDNIKRIFELPEYDDFDSSYQEFMTIQYYKLCGFKKYLLDILPLWSDEPLEISEFEYTMINNNLKEISGFSKKLQNISKYIYTVEDSISPYNGKGELQRLADLL